MNIIEAKPINEIDGSYDDITIGPYSSSCVKTDDYYCCDNRKSAKEYYQFCRQFNVANWIVRYHDNITIKNTGSLKKCTFD